MNQLMMIYYAWLNNDIVILGSAGLILGAVKRRH